MSIIINARGTSQPSFQIGKNSVGAPTVRTGTVDPTIAPLAGNDGDLYIRYGVTANSLYQLVFGVWTLYSGQPQIGVAFATLSYTSTTPQFIITLPANSIILNTEVSVLVAFDGTPTLDIGTDTQNDLLMDNGDIDLTIVNTDKNDTSFVLPGAGSSDIKAYFDFSTSTQGSLQIFIEYSSTTFSVLPTNATIVDDIAARNALSPVPGQFAYVLDSDGMDNPALYIWNGASWDAISSGGGSITYPLTATDGSAASPSYSFSNNGNLGMYRSANNTLAFASNGVLRLSFNTTDLTSTLATHVPSLGINQGSIDTSALLDIVSTTKGVLFPRMTTSNRTSIATPATGLLVYDTDFNAFYYYNGSVWAAIGAGGGGSPGGTSGQVQYNNSGTFGGFTVSGDATLNTGTGAITLATVNSNVGTFGSSTSIPTFTVNAKGLITAASGNAVIAPAGTLTGTTLASNVVSSSLTSVGTLVNLTVTNPISGSITGNAATVTTNANLTGDVTSVGNATTVAKIQGTTVSGTTGSGNVVFSASPTLTGTTNAGNITVSGNILTTSSGTPVMGYGTATQKIVYGGFSGSSIVGGYLQSFGNLNAGTASTLPGGFELVMDASQGASNTTVLTWNGSTYSPVLELQSNGTAIFAGNISAANLSGTNTGNQTITLTSDVTGSGTGSFAATVAKIQGTTVSGTTGSGNVVFSASPTLTGTITAANISASGTITGSNLSGTNTGDQTITLTGDLSGSGTGSFAATIVSNAVTNSKFRQSAANTIVGNPTGSTANVTDISLGGTLTFVTGSLRTVAMTGDVTTSANSFATTVNSYNSGTVFGSMAAQNSSGVAITGGTITGMPTPSGGSDVATKSYVDNATAGLSQKNSCRVATTANLTATYSNGTAGVGATLTNSSTLAAISIDGVSLSVSDRVLVKNQSTQFQNGIYTVTTVGSGSISWVLTRSTDYDQSAEILEGTYTLIEEGTQNPGTLWIETGTTPITVGSGSIVFTQLSVAPQTISFTGDVTGTGAGSIALTVANNAVTNAKFRQSSALSLVGNSTNATANVADIAASAANQIIAVNSAGTSLVWESVSSLLDNALGNVQGDIIYRNGSVWTVLAPGTNGYVLTTGGAGANPSWQAGSGGGGSSTAATLINQAFVSGTDFTPGTTTTLTLSSPPMGAGSLEIFADGVYQNHSTWSLSGSIITFSAVIPIGTSVIEAVYANTAAISTTTTVQDFAAGVDFTAGTSTTITLSSAPPSASLLEISFDGLTQFHNTWSLAGTTVTFNAVVPFGTQNIEAVWSNASAVTTTDIVQDYTAGTDFTAGTSTTITLSSAPSSAAALAITFDGLLQHHSTWALSSKTVTFTSAIPNNVQSIEAKWTTASTGQTSSVNVQDFAAGVDFTAGTSTTITLSSAPPSSASLEVLFDGVAQFHNTWSLSGTTVTFTSTIPSGISNIEARWIAGAGVLPSVYVMPQGRLTLTSNTPVMATDAVAQTTVYYTPYVGNLVPVNSYTYQFTQMSLALDSNSGHTGYHQSTKLFDLFVFSNSGTLTLGTGPAWSSSTSRGSGAGTTQISMSNGLWTNTNSMTVRFGSASGNTTTVAAGAGTYVGTMYATANGQTSMQINPAAASGGSNNMLALYNAYNRVTIRSNLTDSTASWTYTGSTSWRSVNASNSNRINFVDGLQQSSITSTYSNFLSMSAVDYVTETGINLDTNTGTPTTGYVGLASGFTWGTFISAGTNFQPQLGFHFIQAMEQISNAARTTSFNGTIPFMLLTATLEM